MVIPEGSCQTVATIRLRSFCTTTITFRSFY